MFFCVLLIKLKNSSDQSKALLNQLMTDRHPQWFCFLMERPWKRLTFWLGAHNFLRDGKKQLPFFFFKLS